TGSLHQAVNVIIINGKGEILMQQRGHSKDIFPGAWTLSVGGHLQPGSTPMETAIRETREELTFDLNPGKLIPLRRIKAERGFVKQYIFRFGSLNPSGLAQKIDRIRESLIAKGSLPRANRATGIIWVVNDH